MAFDQAAKASEKRQSPDQDGHQNTQSDDKGMLWIASNVAGHTSAQIIADLTKAIKHRPAMTGEKNLGHKVDPCRSHQRHHNRQPPEGATPKNHERGNRCDDQEWRQGMTIHHKSKDYQHTDDQRDAQLARRWGGEWIGRG